MDSSFPDNGSGLGRYFSRIRAFPSLSREQEQGLAEKTRAGCLVSRDSLIRANLGFVVKVASEYRSFGLPLEDLLNEGNLGLIEAARRYDASKGTKFITYAIWWIRKSILRALSERSTLVRVPSYQAKRVREIRETERTLSASLGRLPDREEISAKLSRSQSKVEEALQFALREVSLDLRVGKEHDQLLVDYLADDSLPSIEDDLIRREDEGIVCEAMSQLSAQEKQVVCYRYGIGVAGGRSRTLKEVGKIMHISRERVRQIECRAKKRLRKIFDVRRAVQIPPRPGLRSTSMSA
jgi:RNA polymerase primary sigma factor